MRTLNFNHNNNIDKSIAIIKGPNISINNESYEKIEVEGRSGSLIIKKGTYPDKLLHFDLAILSNCKEDLFNKIDGLIDWKTDIKDNKLFYERHNRYYLIKNIKVNDIQNRLYLLGEFSIDFTCEPFMYAIENYIKLKNRDYFYYKGTVPGECKIKIYGNGNIQLTINNDTVQINNVNEYVELDSKLLSCRNKDKTSKSRDMIGHFPLLSFGKNNISWIGDVSKVEMLPRTAYK